MNTGPAYPYEGAPEFNPNNLANPYNWNVVDSSRGETYFNSPNANSTMVSDSVEMTKRLRAFVPKSSVKEGRQPINNLGYANNQENINKGTYKSSFQ